MLILTSNVTKSSNSSGQGGDSSSGVYPISYNWLSGSAEKKKKQNKNITKRKHAPSNEERQDSRRTRTCSCTHQCLQLSERTSASRHPTTTGAGRQLAEVLEAHCRSDVARTCIHPYPAMVSAPFPGFFPMSVSCILLVFSQKALILLWAGNTLDLCVTANYHGNRRESSLH